MSKMLIIPENLMAFVGSTASAGSEASDSMAAANLLTEEPSEFWRSTSNLQGKSWFKVGNTNLGLLIADSFALISHNLVRGDQYRIASSGMADTVTQEQGYTFYNPNGTVAALCSDIADTVNSHLLVDNGETIQPATWLTGTSDSWSVGLDFATPGATLKLGADRQAICVYAKTAVVTEGKVSISVRIYEGTTPLTTTITRPLSSLTGQWLCFPFDATVLSDPSGTGIRAKVEAQNILAPSADVSIGSVKLDTEFTTNTYGYDSGWLTVSPFVGSGLLFLPQVFVNSNILHTLDSAVEAVYFYVYFRASNSPTDFNRRYEILPTPDAFVQVGSFIVGESWSPIHDIQNGPFIGSHDASSKGRTYGGQLFGSRRYVQRILHMPLPILTPAEAHTLFDRVIWRHGILKKFFVALMPGDATEGTHTGFLASLKNVDHEMLATPAEFMNRAMTLDWEEEI